MSQHISDDLPRLLTGEASRDETLAAAGHLRACPDCQQELVAAVVAHASLSSARRFALPATAPADSGDSSAALPDLTEVFKKVRDEAARPQLTRGRRRALLALAAAAAVATAAGVTIAETTGASSDHSATTVALGAFEGGSAAAQATVTGAGSMHVDASSLPRLGAGKFYEVWLTNSARTRLQAIGLLGHDNEAQLTVSPNVMAQYSAIEISVQQVDQTSYSGHSVVRGSYG